MPVEGEHSLLVHIHGLDCCEGSLRVALYNDADLWLRSDGMVRGRVAPVLGQEQNVEFAGLPPGRYAVAVFQDIDGNGRLNRSFGLVPREPYGFSGNPAGSGRPAFADSSVAVPEEIEISIEMRAPPF